MQKALHERGGPAAQGRAVLAVAQHLELGRGREAFARAWQRTICRALRATKGSCGDTAAANSGASAPAHASQAAGESAARCAASSHTRSWKVSECGAGTPPRHCKTLRIASKSSLAHDESKCPAKVAVAVSGSAMQPASACRQASDCSKPWAGYSLSFFSEACLECGASRPCVSSCRCAGAQSMSAESARSHALYETELGGACCRQARHCSRVTAAAKVCVTAAGKSAPEYT